MQLALLKESFIKLAEHDASVLAACNCRFDDRALGIFEIQAPRMLAPETVRAKGISRHHSEAFRVQMIASDRIGVALTRCHFPYTATRAHCYFPCMATSPRRPPGLVLGNES